MKFNYYTIKYNAILFLIISIFSYDKVTKTVETEEHQETEKGVVELMQAQVKASQIVLGNFERKILARLSLPIATRSSPSKSGRCIGFMSGIVKFISVIEG